MGSYPRFSIIDDNKLNKYMSEFNINISKLEFIKKHYEILDEIPAREGLRTFTSKSRWNILNEIKPVLELKDQFGDMRYNVYNFQDFLDLVDIGIENRKKLSNDCKEIINSLNISEHARNIFEDDFDGILDYEGVDQLTYLKKFRELMIWAMEEDLVDEFKWMNQIPDRSNYLEDKDKDKWDLLYVLSRLKESKPEYLTIHPD